LSAVLRPDIASVLTVDSQLLGALAICLVLIVLALFVMLHTPRAALNRRFGAMTLIAAGWMLTISVALAAKDPFHTAILGRFGFAFASAIPFFLFWMVDALSDSTRGRMARVIVPGVTSLSFALLSLSHLIVAGAKPGLPRANFAYGPAYHLFGVYFLLSFVSGLYTLRKTINTTTGINRLQLRYLLLSISVTGAGGVTTNLLIPLISGSSRYSALAPYFSLLFFSFFAHAIIRHRLMDIRVVIRHGVVYVATIFISTLLFAVLVELLRRFSGYDQDRVPLTDALAIATLLAISFQPLKNWIQHSLNRYVYREPYNYQRIVRETTRRLSTMLDLDPLLDYLSAAVETTLKADAVTVYLRNPARAALIAKVPHSLRQSTHQGLYTPELPEASALSRFLLSDQHPLVREEAIRNSTDSGRLAAAHMLGRLGGELAFPLVDDRTLGGLVIVGPKRSGDPYFSEDIDLLETLIGQAAIAMKNAQLYQQVVLANEYLDNILSTMDSGVIAVNEHGAISLFNPAAERLTRLEAQSLLGEPYERLPSSLVPLFQSSMAARTFRSPFEIVLQEADGTSIPLVCSTALLKQRLGGTHGALIVFSDLTRLKALESEKRRAERLASFGALASGVAHEIKNPLVAIRTFAELLPERFTDSDFREDFSKVVVREIARIDDLVGRLRGIAAPTQVLAGAVDVREPISETLTLLRAQLEQSRTAVRCEFHDPMPFVSVDEAQLKQLFLNLCLNAVEAMGNGGGLSINVFRKRTHGGHWIVVEVSDTGPGIPEAVKSSIFDPFFSTKPRGSGLGLAICRGITDAHAGLIRAENHLDGPGATIIVEFPATDATAVPAAERTVHG
jgi:PAS domain S-box-containing protein